MNGAHRIVLKFMSDQNEVIRLNIPRAKSEKDAESTLERMFALIETGAIMTAQGKPESPIGAQIISTVRNRIM